MVAVGIGRSHPDDVVAQEHQRQGYRPCRDRQGMPPAVRQPGAGQSVRPDREGPCHEGQRERPSPGERRGERHGHGHQGHGRRGAHCPQQPRPGAHAQHDGSGKGGPQCRGDRPGRVLLVLEQAGGPPARDEHQAGDDPAARGEQPQGAAGASRAGGHGKPTGPRRRERARHQADLPEARQGATLRLLLGYPGGREAGAGLPQMALDLLGQVIDIGAPPQGPAQLGDVSVDQVGFHATPFNTPATAVANDSHASRSRTSSARPALVSR